MMPTQRRASQPLLTSSANESENANILSPSPPSLTEEDDTPLVQRLDFIGSSKAVKHLFSLPYSSDASVSVAVHNIGNGTILLDSGDDRPLENAADDDVLVQGLASATSSGKFAANRKGPRSSDQVMENAKNPLLPNRTRFGRQRQRPRSWSTDKQPDPPLDRDENTAAISRQLAQGERYLVSSLSELLGEAISKSELAAYEERREAQSRDEIRNIKEPLEPNDSQNASNVKALSIMPPNALTIGDSEPSLFNQLVESPQKLPTTNAPLGTNSKARYYSSHEETTRFGGANGGSETKDVLADKLHPPKYYASSAVPPPADPREYFHWKFQDMKLLVASDAVIYRGADDRDRSEQSTHKPKVSEIGASKFPNTRSKPFSHSSPSCDTDNSISIRVEDALDMRSKMEHHEAALKKGLYVSDFDVFHRKQTRPNPQKLPPSYADILQKMPLPNTQPSESTQENETSKGENDLSQSESFSDPNLDNVKLQTCIIPSSGVGFEWAELGFSLSPYPPKDMANTKNKSSPTGQSGSDKISSLRSSSPVCTVLDAYLDNVIANVPQLALFLHEHGFIQNIKMIRTEDIPSLMMHPSTLGTTDFPATVSESSHATARPIFSPEIVEMNAAMLLRFLKTNCNRENSTYLLHRTAGETNIQLFDISSISQLRQRKWVWWLALCSYRFACRLEQLQHNVVPHHDKVTRRDYRRRQRNLLYNALNLLEELADMDGRSHETICAAICEHLADTYLWNDEVDEKLGKRVTSKPVPWASSSQPYEAVTVDCLNKAHDHIINGIKKLSPLLTKAKGGKATKPPSIEIEALSMQLFGLHHKLVNVCLRLAEHHLQNYFSSNLIHTLRTAARTLSKGTSLLFDIDVFTASPSGKGSTSQSSETSDYTKSILLQYAWLWEYCGHFARSFAADELWRERGHTSGDDLLSLFQEIEHTCGSIATQCFCKSFGKEWKAKPSISLASQGQISLKSLSGIVVLPKDFDGSSEIDGSILQKEGCHEAISTAKSVLNQKTLIKRDARLVLVAACVCYSGVTDAYSLLVSYCVRNNQTMDGLAGKDLSEGSPLASKFSDTSKGAEENSNATSASEEYVVAPLLCQRLGDACNEIGKVLLEEARHVLSPDFSFCGESIKGNAKFGMSHVSAIMLASAQFWFTEGLKQFTAGNDLRNIALLRCNLCQCCKIRANANVILPGSDNIDSKEKNSEDCLQQAVDHLVLAHEAIGQRDADTVTWDMVSEELAATLLVLGVRRRQLSQIGSFSLEPVAFHSLRLTPGAERAIVDPIERSCKIYQSLGTAHAAHQAAAAHYQLAIYYSKIWTCQRDETKTREKLTAAFNHFGIAHQYFFRSVLGNEPTFVILSLDLSNLYLAVSGEECLSKALELCLDCREAFSPNAISTTLARLNQTKVKTSPSDTSNWFEKMKTLAENVESRISKLLMSLAKIEKEKNGNLKKGQITSELYKNMYRKVLTYKISAGRDDNRQQSNIADAEFPTSFRIHQLLLELSDMK